MNKATIHIKGMHCRSCELLVEDELLKVKGIKKAQVSERDGVAEVYYEGILDHGRIKKAVRSAGYDLGAREKLPLLSKEPGDYKQLGYVFLVLVFLYLIAQELGIFNIAMQTNGSYGNLAVVLLVGLTAGLSTCMALVGGLVLAASAKFVEKNPQATALEKFKPHLLFNAGRIVSFFIFGGLIGLAGSFFQMSPLILGLMTIAVGGVMALLGLQLIDIFPRLKAMKFTLPKSISRGLGIQEKTGEEYSHKNAFIMGATTFFLPCGFTQAMQLFAISSGSAVTGALTMAVFAIGTAPGLLGIGGLTSIIKGAFMKPFFKFAGLVVIFLSIFNISNGMTLAGINVNALMSPSAASQAINDPNVTVENGIQIVKMTQNSSGYSPDSFTIRKGLPVKWIVTSEDPYNCAGSIVSSKLGIRANLKEGENIFEFTPDEIGAIRFTCSMGMFSGSFNVVEAADIESTNAEPEPSSEKPSSVTEQAPAAASCGGGTVASTDGSQIGSCGEGGCGCGQIPAKQAQVENDTVAPVQALQEPASDVQVLKATYSYEEDVQPRKFTVKAGKPVRFEIDAKQDGFGCMGSIMLPGLSQEIKGFRKGETTTLAFMPEKAGTYTITCAMGVPRGTIIVE